TYLPEIPFIIDEATFVNSILKQIKCEVRFENGTEMPIEHREKLNPLFSYGFLPVGDWELILRLFEDVLENINTSRLVYDYLAYEEEGTFAIGHIGTSADGEVGWKGTLIMAIGIPFFVEQYENWTLEDGSEETYQLGIYSGPSDMEWAVEIGDEFEFTIRHASTSGHYYFPETVELPLNNTQVVFEITYLPAIPLVMDNNTFVSSIISRIKCAVRFSNGTDIPSEYQEVLNSLFSHCLLPIGDWKYIESLFGYEPTDLPLYSLIYDYQAYEKNGRFIISNIGSSYHGSKGWSGAVNMTTGSPIYVVDFSWSYYGDGSSNYDRLLLVSVT
ncbi:MAG: hypothetical protein ACTSUB_06070, partial [Candidatus Thorarchaeota archaeon]